jgi:hypothetical protein
MLVLDCFPENHTGICKNCVEDQLVQRPSTKQSLDSLGHDPGQTQPTQRPCPPRRSRNYPSNYHNTAESSIPQRRRDRHATLSSSVTAYSDAGEYPSGRSTYGVSKTNPRKLNNRPVMLLAQEAAVDKQLNEVEGLLQLLTSKELSDLRQRRVDQAASNTPAQEEESTLLDYGVPWHLTTSMRQCLSQICEAWGIHNVKEVFPVEIWPKSGTLWNLPVLQLFLTMAHQYPLPHHRTEISSKFVELVRVRRGKQNAKTQWTIQDAKNTHAWAKHEYGSSPPEEAEVDVYDGRENGVRLSQRPRVPSQKAAALLQSSSRLSRGSPQQRCPLSLNMSSDLEAEHSDNDEISQTEYGIVSTQGFKIGSPSSTVGSDDNNCER